MLIELEARTRAITLWMICKIALSIAAGVCITVIFFALMLLSDVGL